MNIEGLDYNTQRERLILPQYGREIQNMVDYAWDHLALMANFELDIDYPCDVSEALKIATKPEPMSYPMSNILVRHYGRLLFEAFEELKTMEPGARRDAFVRFVANQMKRSLMQWGHGTCDDEKIASDLARYTDGKIQLDLDTFKFEKINAREFAQPRNKKKK